MGVFQARNPKPEDTMLKQLFKSLTRTPVDFLVTLAPIGLVMALAVAIAFDLARTRGTSFAPALALGGLVVGACSGVWLADLARNPGTGWGLAFLGEVFGLTGGVLLALAIYPAPTGGEAEEAEPRAEAPLSAR